MEHRHHRLLAGIAVSVVLILVPVSPAAAQPLRSTTSTPVDHLARAATDRSSANAAELGTNVIDLRTAAARPVIASVAMSYHTPACGVGDTGVLARYLGTDQAATELLTVNLVTGAVVRDQVRSGEYTSAVPLCSGKIAAFGAGGLVSIDNHARVSTLAAIKGVALFGGTGGHNLLTGTTNRPAAGALPRQLATQRAPHIASRSGDALGFAGNARPAAVSGQVAPQAMPEMTSTVTGQAIPLSPPAAGGKTVVAMPKWISRPADASMTATAANMKPRGEGSRPESSPRCTASGPDPAGTATLRPPGGMGGRSGRALIPRGRRQCLSSNADFRDW